MRHSHASVPFTFIRLPTVTHSKTTIEALKQFENCNHETTPMATKFKSCEMYSPLIYSLFLSIRLLHLAIPATLPLQPAISLPPSALSNPGPTFPQFLKYYQPTDSPLFILVANNVSSATRPLASTSSARFPIPHTSLLLHIVSFLDTPIHRGALGRAILHGQTKARQHISRHEDSYLWPEDERKALLPLVKPSFTTNAPELPHPSRYARLKFPESVEGN